MAVSIGSKLALKRGQRSSFIENLQVVTVKHAPFKAGGITCVTFEEVPGVFSLAQFREVGQKRPETVPNGGCAEGAVSPDFDGVLDAMGGLADVIAEEAERMVGGIVDAYERTQRKQPKIRQRVAPRGKRRRK